MELTRSCRRVCSQRGKVSVLLWLLAAALARHSMCFTAPSLRLNHPSKRSSTGPISRKVSMKDYRRMQAENEEKQQEPEEALDTVKPLTGDEMMKLYSQGNTAAAMEIRFLFSFADTNKTGKLNQEAFRKLMRTYMRFNDDDLTEMWQIVEANDFIDLPKVEALLQTTEDPRKCFQNADENGDGWLDTVEWKQAFGDAFHDLRTKQAIIDALFKKQDVNGDRRLSLLEFRGLIRDGSIRRPSRGEVQWAAQNSRRSTQVEEEED